MSVKLIVLIAFILCAFPVSGKPIVLHDPEGDDHGPGSYICPPALGMARGGHDLKALKIEKQDGQVVFTLTFAKTIEWFEVRFQHEGPVVRVFSPVVDIYMSGPTGGTHERLLPGRRVRPELKWSKAVVISAVPDLIKAHYSRVASDLAKDTCFVRSVRVVGPTLTATAPKRCATDDLENSAYLVVVTGLGHGAGIGDFLFGNTNDPTFADPFVLQVQKLPGQCGGWDRGGCWCGGCEPCGWHPYVLDAIVPYGRSQQALLSAYSEKEKRPASLPFVDAHGWEVRKVGVQSHTAGSRHPVVSVRNRQFTIKTENQQYTPGTIGAIICPGEKAGGTAVVMGDAAGFTVMEKTDDMPVCEGAVVEF